MTSLSDSQNIDVDRHDGGAHPNLPAGSPLQACPHCEALIDITEREPLDVIECPGCGQGFAVTGQIDHYQIIDVAGRGGMGVVYRAYDAGLDRYVAIKLLKKSQSNDTQLIQQLETEAAITASVTDSNVVRVYGTGTDRGRFFLAMELVDKGSLDELIHLQGRVAEAQVLQVGMQIASGLKAAQQHGLIHRDVKPGNILFADAHTAKIVDFGLAIFAAQEESVRGEIWGTPYYVAPEKLDQEPEDFRSDMYSLGATLFHALAGRPPFEAENASMVALKHLKSQAVSLQAFAPWVSNPTAHIINRTLAKNPDDRFQSYDELIHNFGYALEQLQQNGNAPQKRARVVLETEEDRRSWTWVVLGMGILMAVLMVVFFMMRPKGGAQQTAGAARGKAPQATSAQGKFASLEGPLDSLSRGDDKAVDEFRALIAEDKLPPTDHAWAQYLEGVAALVANRKGEARTAFGKVEPLTSRMKDAKLGKFLATSANRLVRSDRIPVSESENITLTNYEAIALLAYALQNWQQGQFDDAVTLLGEFRDAHPEGSDAWIRSLRPLATIYRGYLAAFDMDVAFFKEATTPAARTALANKLQQHSPALAARAEAVIKPFAKEIEEQRALLSKVPGEGLYRITNKRSGKSLDVSGYNTGQGGALTQYDFRGQPNQIFELSTSGAGNFRFRSIHSLTAIDVPNQKKDEGLEIKMWTPNDTAAQQWVIEPRGEGFFKLRAAASNLLLAPQNQSMDNGAKIVQAADKDQDEQLWKFEPAGRKLGDDWFASSLGERHGSDKAEYKNGVFKLTDQGIDIWGRADKAVFVMRPVQGDFDFAARVVSISKTHQWTKAGLIVRTGLIPEQMNVAAILTPDRMVTHQRRTSNNGDTTSEKKPGFDLPRWVKIERRGEKFTTFHSTDGQKWEEIATDTVKMHMHTLIGLVLSSHDESKTATAEFDNVSYTKR